MRLKKHLSEMAILSKRSEWNYDEFMKDLRKLDRSADVLWRGWRAPTWKRSASGGLESNFEAGGALIKVGSQRSTAGMFFGKHLEKYNVDFIMKSLGLANYSPVFTTRNHSQAKFFGTPYVVVPIGSFKSLYNPEVHDIMSAGVDWEKREKTRIAPMYKQDFEEQKLIDIVKGYKKVDGFPKEDTGYGEIMLLVDKYWLVSPATFIDMTKGKLREFNKDTEIKTYGDLYKMMENYLKFYRWKFKKDMEENPNFRKTYLGPHGKYENVPREWIKELGYEI